MSGYLDSSDKKFTHVYREQTPDVLDAFNAFDAAVFATEGRAIPLKFRELMALAVAMTTQCAYCIDAHSKAAVAAGATDEELAEAAWVTTAIRAGGGYTHGRLAFKLAHPHGAAE
jgi:AhpD family alkylhydroperoxidase